MGISMDGKKIRSPLFFLFLITSFLTGPARAATVELAGMLAYSTSDFADGYKSVQRRYTGSIDFKFTAVSALQLEYTDQKTFIGYPTTLGNRIPSTREEITYLDKIYSFNWVQNLVSTKWIIQPYFL